MKTEKINDDEGVTESLVESRKHELKCQLCAGETLGGVHTVQGRINAESHTCKHICRNTCREVVKLR